MAPARGRHLGQPAQLGRTPQGSAPLMAPNTPLLMGTYSLRQPPLDTPLGLTRTSGTGQIPLCASERRGKP